jgi:hypothetical protein
VVVVVLGFWDGHKSAWNSTHVRGVFFYERAYKENKIDQIHQIIC